MSRSLALGLCATGALAIASCRQDGSYRVTWDFLADSTPGALEQNAAAGCGQHGVDAIWVTAVDTTSDSDEVIAICTPGQVTRSVPAGSWTVEVQAIDAESAVLASVSPEVSIPVFVVNGGAVTDVPVTLTVPPACSDGIDNDSDGRVDLDDPGCAGDPSGAHE